MKIIAVIPARAGSKGIPDKNLRLLNGKPLICYQIENARKSRYISKIIVSTDSEAISAISSTYEGVVVRNRSAELSTDNITLDSVIFDAVQNEECDAVITLQPTSPTLKVATIDKAIEFFCSTNVDTLISVKNDPHLSWSNKNGLIVPDYKERLNRQYLPKSYRETGGFLISRKSCIFQNSRIGKNVQVFEVPDDEAIDIDSFSDFQTAESVLTRKTIGIFVNGNSDMGTGHVYRALEIADSLSSKPFLFYNSSITNKAIFGPTTHNLIPVTSEEDLFKRLPDYHLDVFINDILSTSLQYMIGLRMAVGNKTKIINFEDEGDGAKKADCVINALLPRGKRKNAYAGPKYYFAPKLFSVYPPIKIQKNIRKVAISFGGSDPSDYTETLLSIIKNPKFNNISFIVILGKAKKNADQILRNPKSQNVVILKDIQNMPKILSSCDAVVTSRGRTCFECALLGIPTLAIAQNPREKSHIFANPKNGFIYAGEKPKRVIIEKAFLKLLSLDSKQREIMQKRMLSNDLRNGYKRVIKLIVD